MGIGRVVSDFFGVYIFIIIYFLDSIYIVFEQMVKIKVQINLRVIRINSVRVRCFGMYF